MIGRKLCYFALVLTLLGLCLRAGNAALAVLLICVLLMPLCLLGLNLYLRKRVRLHFSLPVNGKKGSRIRGCLTVENPTAFPIFLLRCQILAENRLNGELQTLLATDAVLPKSEKNIPLELESSWCGRIVLSLKSAKLYDCFGLLGTVLDTEAKGSVTVQPETFHQVLTLSEESEAPLDAEQYSQLRPGRDLSEPFQIREYVEGDSIRQVHWKLSQKLDRLIIRDPSLPIARAVAVVWERCCGSNSALEAIDAQAEVVVTACKTLLEQSIPVVAAWNDVEHERCVMQRLTDVDELVALLPKMMSAREKSGVPSAAQLVAQKTDLACSHILYITAEQDWSSYLTPLGRITVLSCAETGNFTAENYVQQLLELVI